MKHENKKKSKIEIELTLDENKIPEKIFWSAEDGDIKNQKAEAVLLSVWDGISKETLYLSLWIKKMPVHEMKIFFYQTLLQMSNTLQKSTNDEKMTATMKDFCDFFAEKLELKK